MKKKAIQLLVTGLIVALAVNYLNGLLFEIWVATETNKKRNVLKYWNSYPCPLPPDSLGIYLVDRLYFVNETAKDASWIKAAFIAYLLPPVLAFL